MMGGTNMVALANVFKCYRKHDFWLLTQAPTRHPGTLLMNHLWVWNTWNFKFLLCNYLNIFLFIRCLCALSLLIKSVFFFILGYETFVFSSQSIDVNLTFDQFTCRSLWKKHTSTKIYPVDFFVDESTFILFSGPFNWKAIFVALHCFHCNLGQCWPLHLKLSFHN